jgi:hypothetical protein
MQRYVRQGRGGVIGLTFVRCCGESGLTARRYGAVMGRVWFQLRDPAVAS